MRYQTSPNENGFEQVGLIILSGEKHDLASIETDGSTDRSSEMQNKEGGEANGADVLDAGGQLQESRFV
jgi:hypothetical protein